MTVYLMRSLPRIPYIHRIYIYIWLWPTLDKCVCSHALCALQPSGTSASSGGIDLDAFDNPDELESIGVFLRWCLSRLLCAHQNSYLVGGSVL